MSREYILLVYKIIETTVTKDLKNAEVEEHVRRVTSLIG